MGIESDKVVYEYLSRVGDVAQQRQLPSATRMRLVSELRNEIDRRRAKVTVDSPAAVRRIIDRLGSPDDVVGAAGGGSGTTAPAGRGPGPVGHGGSGDGGPGGGGAAAPAGPGGGAGGGIPAGFGGGAGPQVPSGVVPAQPERHDPPPRRLRRGVPRPRPAAPQPPPAAPSPPHLAGEHELGAGLRPDWWRVENGPAEAMDSVPGFVGGVEIPDLLRQPQKRVEPEAGAKAAPEAETGEAVAPVTGADAGAGAAETAGRRRFRLPFPRASGGWTNPLLLIAAAALVVGAVIGNWVALVLGWLIAYGSRRLTPVETKWAVMGMPGVVAAAGIVWLWGRTDGRWGDPIAQGHMRDALAETWPWVLRGAAVASALFLVWRSRRPR